MDSLKLGRRTERYLIFRLAVIPMAFVLVTICQAGMAPYLRPSAFDFFYGLLGFYTLLALVSLPLARRTRSRRAFAWIQVVADFLVAGTLIWGSGGVSSVFGPLLFVAVFNASTILPGAGVLAAASLSTLFLALTSLEAQLGGASLGHGALSTPVSLSGIAARLVANAVALHVVALLGTRLSRGFLSLQSVQSEIIENMAEGLVAIDGNRRVVEFNGEARRIFGIPADLPAVGRPLAEALPGERLRLVREAFLVEGRERQEFNLPTLEGATRPVEAKVSRVSDEGGRLRCRIGLFSDMSLKKEIERAERRIQKLEQLYDMARGIAHEIRNPLASIQGCAQEIRRAVQGNVGQGNAGQAIATQGAAGQTVSGGIVSGTEKLADIICRESGRLDRLIEDLLSNARRGPVNLVPLDLRGVVEETAIQLRKHSGISGRRVLFDLPAEPVRVRGDAQRLKQVLLNLGLNAIEATDPARGEISFRFARREFTAMDRRRAGERRLVPGIEVEVADNGSGIPQELKTLVFTPFFSTKEKGHGLGLAVVHRIVSDHLGTVDVESTPGEGTRFRIWMPLCGAHEESGAEDELSLPSRESAREEVVRV